MPLLLMMVAVDVAQTAANKTAEQRRRSWVAFSGSANINGPVNLKMKVETVETMARTRGRRGNCSGCRVVLCATLPNEVAVHCSAQSDVGESEGAREAVLAVMDGTARHGMTEGTELIVLGQGVITRL